MTNTVNLDTTSSKRGDVNGKDKDGNTPLMAASMKGDLQRAKLLLGKKAFVNFKNYMDQTPLMMACLLYTSPSPRD